MFINKLFDNYKKDINIIMIKSYFDEHMFLCVTPIQDILYHIKLITSIYIKSRIKKKEI